MRLSCTKSPVDNKYCRCSIDTWICSVIGPDLNEFDLILDDIVVIIFTYYLPTALSACTNLVSLGLSGDIYIKPQFTKVVRCLPSLKKLKLPAMEMPELNAFLVGCPILENLNTYIYYENYANICFPPTLKSLQIDVDIASVGAFFYDNPLCSRYLNLTQIRFDDVSNL
ncbi:transmembrane protein, putative [Medicago truncatula]|uniref:Transmembrane protein, putative n=1 Tax=Medicago truncatula TaxID=3880 RepID=G7JVA5_MEDTR|nr:transmembrane protein, putative [Medicago truncatula]